MPAEPLSPAQCKYDPQFASPVFQQAVASEPVAAPTEQEPQRWAFAVPGIADALSLLASVANGANGAIVTLAYDYADAGIIPGTIVTRKGRRLTVVGIDGKTLTCTEG